MNPARMIGWVVAGIGAVLVLLGALMVLGMIGVVPERGWFFVFLGAINMVIFPRILRNLARKGNRP